MIELIFSRSGAASLKLLNKTNRKAAHCKMRLTPGPNSGDKYEGFTHKPSAGAAIHGNPSDIAFIQLMGDVGDISVLPDWTSRLKIIRDIADVEEMESDDWMEKEVKRNEALIRRLQSAASNGEAVRIWWSDAAYETCGFYWAMSILKDAVGNISSIKVPRLWPTAEGCSVINGTEELLTEDFLSVLYLEKRIEYETRNAYSLLWNQLVCENAPLRAVLNGMLCSVPENFYDYAIFKELPDGDFKVIDAVGRAIGEGLGGQYDWWFARRIRTLIARGDFEVVKNSDNFYYTMIRSTRSPSSPLMSYQH